MVKQSGEAWEMWTHMMTSGRQKVDTRWAVPNHNNCHFKSTSLLALWTMNYIDAALRALLATNPVTDIRRRLRDPLLGSGNSLGTWVEGACDLWSQCTLSYICSVQYGTDSSQSVVPPFLATFRPLYCWLPWSPIPLEQQVLLPSFHFPGSLVPGPIPFFTLTFVLTLLLLCIIVNANQRLKNGVGLGARLLPWDAIEECNRSCQLSMLGVHVRVWVCVCVCTCVCVYCVCVCVCACVCVWYEDVYELLLGGGVGSGWFVTIGGPFVSKLLI